MNNWKPFEKNNEKNLSNLVKEMDIQVQETQSLKQDEPKEVHSETYHN